MAKYKIKRGQFIRGEGEDRKFKTYGVGDTVEMTDAEANAFGRHRLISGGGVILPVGDDVAAAEASRIPDSPVTAGKSGKRKPTAE